MATTRVSVMTFLLGWLLLLGCMPPGAWGKHNAEDRHDNIETISQTNELEIEDGGSYEGDEVSASGLASLEDRELTELMEEPRGKSARRRAPRGSRESAKETGDAQRNLRHRTRGGGFYRSSSSRSDYGPPYIGAVMRRGPVRRMSTPPPVPVDPLPIPAPPISIPPPPPVVPRAGVPTSLRLPPRRPTRRFRPGRSSYSYDFSYSYRSMSMSMSTSRSARYYYRAAPRAYALPVESTLVFTFFPGTGRPPSTSEISNLVQETAVFYYDTLRRDPYTRNGIASFQLANVATEYAPGGNPDQFILYFDGRAIVPPNAGLRSDVISRIMSNANYNSFIRNYAWRASPLQQNEFYQTNSVDFYGQAIRYGSSGGFFLN